MNKNCTVSIITICYNAEKSIAKTMQSVLAQENEAFEYIIIDGASNDHTLNIVSQYRDARVQVYSEPDRGISDAFNKGISKASGEYLYFLNSGDYLISTDCLDSICNTLRDNRHDIVTYAVESLYSPKFPQDEGEGWSSWEASMIPHQGTFIKRNVFERVGYFNENYRIRMDYDFFSRCYKEQCSFQCVPEIIAHYDADGISSNDRYRFDKEGLAIRFLYRDDIDEADMKLVQSLYQKKGNDHGHYRLDLKQDVCANDAGRRDFFWSRRHYVIYGAGVGGYKLYQIMKGEIHPDKIAVCDTNKCGLYLKDFDQTVIPLSEITANDPDSAVIISIQSKRSLCEVFLMLNQAGILKQNIFIYDEENMGIF